jgi:hypothetical protein
MLEAKTPWNERQDTPTRTIVVILTAMFGITSLSYFAGGLFLIGKTSAAQAFVMGAVLWIAAAALMYTARSFWKRYPGAIRWGFISLAITIAVWMKWPFYSTFLGTALVAGCLIWLIYDQS